MMTVLEKKCISQTLTQTIHRAGDKQYKLWDSSDRQKSTAEWDHIITSGWEWIREIVALGLRCWWLIWPESEQQYGSRTTQWNTRLSPTCHHMYNMMLIFCIWFAQPISKHCVCNVWVMLASMLVPLAFGSSHLATWHWWLDYILYILVCSVDVQCSLDWKPLRTSREPVCCDVYSAQNYNV